MNIIKSDFESTVSLNISPSSTNLNTGELSKKLNLKMNSNENQTQPQTLKSIIVQGIKNDQEIQNELRERINNEYLIKHERELELK